jgi:hypothetical protein
MDVFKDIEPRSAGKGFTYDAEEKGWDIRWGGCEYWIEDARIDTPLRLAGWAVQLGRKRWEGSTAQNLAAWVDAVCEHKGWIYHPL